MPRPVPARIRRGNFLHAQRRAIRSGSNPFIVEAPEVVYDFSNDHEVWESSLWNFSSGGNTADGSILPAGVSKYGAKSLRILNNANSSQAARFHRDGSYDTTGSGSPDDLIHLLMHYENANNIIGQNTGAGVEVQIYFFKAASFSGKYVRTLYTLPTYRNGDRPPSMVASLKKSDWQYNGGWVDADWNTPSLRLAVYVKNPTTGQLLHPDYFSDVTIDALLVGGSGPVPVTFSFDDNYASQYQACLDLEEKGWRASLVSTKNLVGNGTNLTESQLLELQGRGHGILNHGTNHDAIDFPDSTKPLLTQQVLATLDDIEEGYQYHKATYNLQPWYAATRGAFNDATLDYVYKNHNVIGHRNARDPCATRHADGTYHYGYSSLFDGDVQDHRWGSGCFELSSVDTITGTAALLIDAINAAVENSCAVHIYGHEIVVGATSTRFERADWLAVLDHIKTLEEQGKVLPMAWHEWANILWKLPAPPLPVSPYGVRPNPHLDAPAEPVFRFDTAPTSVGGPANTAGSTNERLNTDTMAPRLAAVLDYASEGNDCTRVQMQQTANSQDYRLIWSADADPAVGLPEAGIDLSAGDTFSVVFSCPQMDYRLSGGDEDNASMSQARFLLFVGNGDGGALVQSNASDTNWVKSRHNVHTFKRSDFGTDPTFSFDNPIKYLQVRIYGGDSGTDSYEPEILLRGVYPQVQAKPIICIGADDGHITQQYLVDAANARGLKLTLNITPTNLNNTGNLSDVATSLATTDYWNWDDVRTLQAQGHEIGMHPNEDADVDYALFLDKLSLSEKLFRDNGITWTGLAWHQGKYGNDAIETVTNSPYYKYARATSQTMEGINAAPVVEQSPYTIRSSGLGFGSTLGTVANFQAAYDKVVANGGWFCTNSHVFVASGANDSLETNYADIDDMLDILAAGVTAGEVEVRTVSDALTQMGVT